MEDGMLIDVNAAAWNTPSWILVTVVGILMVDKVLQFANANGEIVFSEDPIVTVANSVQSLNANEPNLVRLFGKVAACNLMQPVKALSYISATFNKLIVVK
jgi:hypothetical protein